MSASYVMLAYSGGDGTDLGQIALIGGAVVLGLVLLGALLSFAARRR
jgi:hypothetical protein